MQLTQEKLSAPFVQDRESTIEIPSGMTRTHFAAGPKRFVYIDKAALQENVLQGASYQTCIIEEESGEQHHFHNVIIQGPALLEFSRNPMVKAHQYLVTEAAMDGLTNLADWQGVFKPEPQISVFASIWQWTKRALGYVPLVGCIIHE
jgi:hypothetical protein